MKEQVGVEEEEEKEELSGRGEGFTGMRRSLKIWARTRPVRPKPAMMTWSLRSSTSPSFGTRALVSVCSKRARDCPKAARYGVSAIESATTRKSSFESAGARIPAATASPNATKANSPPGASRNPARAEATRPSPKRGPTAVMRRTFPTISAEMPACSRGGDITPYHVRGSSGAHQAHQAHQGVIRVRRGSSGSSGAHHQRSKRKGGREVDLRRRLLRTRMVCHLATKRLNEISIPTVMKNSPRRRPRYGAMSLSTCRANSVSASSSPA